MIGVESFLECVAPALAMIRQNMIPLSVPPIVLVLLSNIAMYTLSCELLLHKGIRVREREEKHWIIQGMGTL